MKKFLKITGICIVSLLALLYTAFLFILPKCIDLSKYDEEIQKIVLKEARLTLKYDNLKLVTTPLLGVGIKADNITLTMPDNSLLFSANNIKTAVSLPHLLLFTVKVPLLNIENPFINIEIMKNNEEYKIVKLIEDILNEKKASTFAIKQVEEENTGFNFSRIKIILPKIKLSNYKVLVTDVKSGHYLDLHGDDLIFGYFNAKRIKIKTNSFLYSDKNKNLSLNLDINTFLPEPKPKLDKEDDPAEKIDFPFFNPVTTYQNYDLKANVNSKIKINKKGEISSFGFFNVENLTMKISSIKIPDCFFRLKTFGKTANIDTNIFTHENENLRIFGKLNYGKKPRVNLNIKTEKIALSNLLTIAKATAESLQISHELNNYKAQGIISADCVINTNFKKLKSNGFIKITDGALAVKNIGEVFSNVNINFILNENVLNIKKSGLKIGNSPVTIDGLIDEKSFTDISVVSEDISLPLLFNAFAQKQYKNAYNFKSGKLSSLFNIKGKMKDVQIQSELRLTRFDFADKKNTFEIKDDLLNFKFNFDRKTSKLLGRLENLNLNVLFPKTLSSVKIPEIYTKLDETDLEITPGIIKFNDKSALSFNGKVSNYPVLEDIDFTLEGELNNRDIIKFIGRGFEKYFNAKGNIPVKLGFKGDIQKQTLQANISANGDNYITPIDFNMLQNHRTMLQTTIDFKPNRIKIKDTGLYTVASYTDENGKEILQTNKIMGIDGTIEEKMINLLKIDIPKTISGKIFAFPKSDFQLDKTILYVYGNSDAPLIKGDIGIKNLTIPELFTGLNNFSLNFKGNELDFNLDDIMLASSDLNINGKIRLFSFSDIFDFNVLSKNFKVEDVQSVSERALKYLPETSGNSSSEQNIPVKIHNGRIDFKKISTGNINLFNTFSDMNLTDSVLSLRNLGTEVFNGKTGGDILVNLKNMAVITDLKGNGINVDKALYDSAGMKDSLNGIMGYSAKLAINAGAKNAEEQLKGIDGSIDFSIKDGQFGPFGKIENLILAENIRESEFFKTALGGIINSLATIDTTHFNELKGHLVLKDGICNIEPITSSGSVMNLHILGNFNILKNYADMKVKIKITSIISNLLGPLNAINPVNLVNSAASLNVVSAKAFSLFCETMSEEEMNAIPKFENGYVDKSATKFQLGVRGDAAKPLTLIKSFKWLATPLQFNKAEEFAQSLPQTDEISAGMSIEEAIAYSKALEEEKKTLKYKIKHFFVRDKKE